MNGPRCEHDPNEQTRHTKQLSGAHAFALQTKTDLHHRSTTEHFIFGEQIKSIPAEIS